MDVFFNFRFSQLVATDLSIRVMILYKSKNSIYLQQYSVSEYKDQQTITRTCSRSEPIMLLEQCSKIKPIMLSKLNYAY